jgi:hypothetical protein
MQAMQPQLHLHITAAVEWITPEAARKALGNKAANRHISRVRVQEYARDIKAGNWGLTGETIIYDYNEQLIEGQHRMMAIILADQGIYSLVVRGVDPAEFVRINSGKPRTMADTLGIKGENAPSTLAAAMKLLYLYQHGLFLCARADNDKANTFFFKLGEGADLGRTSPLYQLRERLLAARLEGNKLLPVEEYALILKAWNAYVRGQEVKRLTWSSQEAFP